MEKLLQMDRVLKMVFVSDGPGIDQRTNGKQFLRIDPRVNRSHDITWGDYSDVANWERHQLDVTRRGIPVQPTFALERHCLQRHVCYRNHRKHCCKYTLTLLNVYSDAIVGIH